MPTITLDRLVPGESGRIIRISGKGAVRRRLVDMGLTSGAVIDMVKVSPLGDPVEYRLRGYHLSLRKSEAKTIEVELIDSPILPAERGSFMRSNIPLARCKPGQQVRIIQIRGGRRIRRRLIELGLSPGADLRILCNDITGPLIVSLNDKSRLGIRKGMAMHILVDPS